MSWIEPAHPEGHALRFARREPGGEWSQPRTVARGASWFVNWADFPSMAALADGTLFAHWLVKSGPGTYAYEVRLAISTDGGASWGDPLVPHGDGTRSEHGFVSLIPLGARMGVVWLDGRNTVTDAGEPKPHGEPGAEMALRFASVDAAGSIGPESVLDGRVCDCCQTGAAAVARGPLVVYRDRSTAELRDVSFTRRAEGVWSEPSTLAADGWRIEGCPVNGPAIDASGERVAAAWFAAPEERRHASAIFSADGGATWGRPVRVDDGRPLGRVDVALLHDGDALVSWMEQVQGGAQVRVRRVASDGTRGGARVVAGSSGQRASGFPRMVRSGDEVVIAWTDDAGPARVRSAVLRLR